ncbi:replication factor C subunit 3-like isoform X2 [Ananas comosus]|uniref:Replication factor C subunit 3-like isoform X2 n=1 Tax=Ananas comosus TaxID=4615 RepID=A0A6P5FFD1_ANACO|nr:replication factor C subunit 3-like isoform X2 [Ananas comosus]
MAKPFVDAPTRRSSDDPSICSSSSSSASAAAALRRRTRPPPPPPGTLSASLAEERLHERSVLSDSARCPRHPLLNPCRRGLGGAASALSFSSALLLKIHDWGASCFLKRAGAGATATAAVPPAGEVAAPPLAAAPRDSTEKKGSRLQEPSPPRQTVVRSEVRPLREIEPAPVGKADDAIATAERKSQRNARMTMAVISPSVLPLDEGVRAAAGNSRKPKLRRVSAGSSSSASRGSEFVWANKYQPKSLKEFICNRDHAEVLYQMAIKQQCSHFIFEGPPGVGKSTMALAFLRDVFGPDKLKTRNGLKRLELKGELVASIDVSMRISDHHVEVNLSELQGYEKYVINALMNETLALSAKVGSCDHSDCRAVVLHEADKLSNDAQHYIRWLMEKYKGCNRIFFCCSDALKLQVVKHLCTTVKLLPPSVDEIVEVLEFIAKEESIDLPHHLARKIADNSTHNLRQAIRSFEASWKSNNSFTENQEILTGWEGDIANIAKNIVEEQSPRQLYVIRGKLKKLIEHNVSPDFIFSLNNSLTLEDGPMAFGDIKQEGSGKKYHDPKRDVQYFMRIEEFTAKFMSFYKSIAPKSIPGEVNC